MSDIRIVRDYPHSPAKVWRALTDSKLIALWAMRPEGFAPVVGTKCRFRGEPNKHWRGYVDCEIIEVVEKKKLRYSWVGDDTGETTYVTYAIEARGGGTRLTFTHEGFRGVRGFMLAKLIMTPGWKQMTHVKFPAVLDNVDDEGHVRAGSTLKPRFGEAQA